MRISDWSSDVCSSDLTAEMSEDIPEMPRPLAGIEQPRQPHSRNDHAPGRGPESRQHPHRRARAERIAAEIVFGQFQMLDQCHPVPRERIAGTRENGRASVTERVCQYV